MATTASARPIAWRAAFTLASSESAAAPASPIRLYDRLQRGEEGQGCSWRDRAAGTEQGARDLLERRQRRVDLERLRERRGALIADDVALKPCYVADGAQSLQRGPHPAGAYRVASPGELARKQSFLDLDQDERPEQPEHVDPQHTLRAYMDDQYAVGPPSSLAFECARIGTISQHHAGLVPNIDKDKLKTGMLIPHIYGRTEELKTLFPGVIISFNTPPTERGVKMLGSILRNSHKDSIKVRLEHMLREAIHTYACPCLISTTFKAATTSCWWNRCTTTGSCCRTRLEAWASRTPTCFGIPRTWAAGARFTYEGAGFTNSSYSTHSVTGEHHRVAPRDRAIADLSQLQLRPRPRPPEACPLGATGGARAGGGGAIVGPVLLLLLRLLRLRLLRLRRRLCLRFSE
jgi:hypothetical protein